ncbi:MAG: hypothetical protein SFX73_35270 [Kofleriaceae bacterium]|nr:hypothetical protein [Kofleriaceae bacterium]
MNMLSLLCAALALGACTIEPIQLDFDPGGAGVVVYDDGSKVHIAGCPDREFLGCGPVSSLDEMTVTADGVAHVATDGGGDINPDAFLGLFRDGPLKVSLPRPASGFVQVTLDGVTTGMLLPESFAVSAPAAPIERSAGALEVGHDGLSEGHTQALMITTCGTHQRTDVYEETEPGAFTFPLEPFADYNACTHEIHVDETLDVVGTGIAITTVRIEKRFVASTP